MKNFQWITGVCILLFLVASALPAYSAQPWPEGGDTGPADRIEAYEDAELEGADFVALVNNNLCKDGSTPAQGFYNGAGSALERLEYTQRPKDNLDGSSLDEEPNGDDVMYPLPKAYMPAPKFTGYKDFAGLAFKLYYSMYDTEIGKYSGAAGNVQNIIDLFLSKVNLDPAAGYHGGLIDAPTTQDLIDSYYAFVALKNCLEPVVE